MRSVRASLAAACVVLLAVASALTEGCSPGADRGDAPAAPPRLPDVTFVLSPAPGSDGKPRVTVAAGVERVVLLLTGDPMPLPDSATVTAAGTDRSWRGRVEAAPPDPEGVWARVTVAGSVLTPGSYVLGIGPEEAPFRQYAFDVVR